METITEIFYKMAWYCFIISCLVWQNIYLQSFALERNNEIFNLPLNWGTLLLSIWMYMERFTTGVPFTNMD